MAKAPSPFGTAGRRGGEWNWASHGAWLIPRLSLFLSLAMWEAAVRYFAVPVYLLPAPSVIARKLVASYPLFLEATMHSVVAIIIGFGLAVLVGIPAATLMIYSEWFRRSVYPILLTAQVYCRRSRWLHCSSSGSGFGLLPKAVLMTFPYFVFSNRHRQLDGAQFGTTRKSYVNTFDGRHALAVILEGAIAPGALPSMFGGFKVAITFAVVGTIVAEFVGSDNGLGYILVLARGNLDTVTVFAAILWLIVIGFLFYFAVEMAEWFCIRGRAAGRSQELGAGL